MKTYKEICQSSKKSFISEKEYHLLSFKEYITERLQFTTREAFSKQLIANNCDLLDYVSSRNGNNYILIGKVLEIYSTGDSLEDKVRNFNSFLEKYSYRVSRIIRALSGIYVEIVPENFRDSPTEDFKNLYIHLSPVDKLDDTGLKPKSSKSVDSIDMYDERIYLLPLTSLLDDMVDLDDEDAIFKSIYGATAKVAQLFNLRRAVKLDYWVYLVNLGKQPMQTYRDPEYTERNAVYVKNFIKPEVITKIGKIEKE